MASNLFQMAFKKYSLQKGLKVFKNNSIQGVHKEMKQLNDTGTFDSVDMDGLRKVKRNNALNTLSFLKEKRCRTIKCRTCVDGRPQATVHQKDEIKSPIVSI